MWVQVPPPACRTADATRLRAEQSLLLAYVVGLALGDGNLSNPNGRAVRLRITCDARYPALGNRIARAIRELLPHNRVSFVRKPRNCFDVSCYSNAWEDLLGWKVGYGTKIQQRVSVPAWIKRHHEYRVACLKGLFETDGSIYSDRGYPMAMFASASVDLAWDVSDMMSALGFRPRLYEIRKNRRRPIFHVRLSRDTAAFVAMVNPCKS